MSIPHAVIHAIESVRYSLPHGFASHYMHVAARNVGLNKAILNKANQIRGKFKGGV